MSRQKCNAPISPTGKQIRKALIDIDQSAMDLARELGVSAYYIREIYAERRKGKAIRKKIADYLAKQLKARDCYLPLWARDRERVA